LAIRSNFWRCSIRLMVMNSIVIPSSSPKSSNSSPDSAQLLNY
jgi:hypothetical protein